MLFYVIATILLFSPRFSTAKVNYLWQQLLCYVRSSSLHLMSNVAKKISTVLSDSVTLKKECSSISFDSDTPLKLPANALKFPPNGTQYIPYPILIPIPISTNFDSPASFPYPLNLKDSLSQCDSGIDSSCVTAPSTDCVEIGDEDIPAHSVTSSTQSGVTSSTQSEVETLTSINHQSTDEETSQWTQSPNLDLGQLWDLYDKQEQRNQLLEKKLLLQEQQLQTFAEQLMHMNELLQRQYQVVQEQHEVINQHEVLLQEQVTLQHRSQPLGTVYPPSKEGNNLRSKHARFQKEDQAVSLVRFHQLKSLALADKFDGSYTKYRMFKIKFCTLIQSMSLSNLEMALVLYLSLEDEVISNLGDITTEGILDYNKMWSELDELHCTPSNGPYSHFAALHTISSWTVCNSHNKLQQLYKFIKLHYLALQRLGVEDHAEGFTMLFLSKLSGTTSERVSRLMNESRGKPIISRMLEILREELQNMELQEMAVKTCENDLHTEHTDIEEKQKTPAVATKPSILKPPLQKRFNCLICNTNLHSTNMCRRFGTPMDYHREFFRRNLCYNCLKEGHKSFACPQAKVCDLCSDNRKHTPLLCRNYYSQHNLSNPVGFHT